MKNYLKAPKLPVLNTPPSTSASPLVYGLTKEGLDKFQKENGGGGNDGDADDDGADDKSERAT